MPIKAILFDLDDTLLWDERSVKESFLSVCQIAAEQYDVPVEAIEAAVKEEAKALYESFETFSFTKMIGINPFEGLWGNFTEGTQEEFRKLQQLAPEYRKQSWINGLKTAGIDDPVLGAKLAELFPQERRKRPIVYEETFTVLKKLKDQYALLLLTNGSPDLQQEKLDGVPDLAPFFDHIVISGAFGKGKPDPSIFHHAMELLGIEAFEGVMVGDKLTTDILGSQRAGMNNVWINRHRKERSNEIIPTYEIHHLEDIYAILESI